GSRKGRLTIEPRGRWGLFFRCQGSYSGCGEDRHQPRGLPRAWNMRAFTVLNRAVYDGAKTPPANTKKGAGSVIDHAFQGVAPRAKRSFIRHGGLLCWGSIDRNWAVKRTIELRRGFGARDRAENA